jgi:hypothetical protein
MTPEAEFLLLCLLHGPAAPSAPLDWELLLALADSHGVLPLFYREYPAQNGDLPDKFVRHFREQWTFSLFLASELEGLLKEFAARGIEALALKGPVLAELLYGHTTLRPSCDLDLLVSREDFTRAELLLIELGFEPIGVADDYHRDFGRNGTFVELHFGIGSPSSPNFDLHGAWTRARNLEFRGQPVRFLSPVDLVLYLSLHGLKHRFARLVWVRDISRGIEALNPSDTLALLEEADTQRLRNVLLLSCEIARRTFGTALPPNINAALRARPHLAREAGTWADRILATVADPTTEFQNVSSYLQLADTPGHRWRHRLQFFVPTQQDYLWAARYHIHPKCMPLLRPLRLVIKYGPAPALRTLFPGSADRG